MPKPSNRKANYDISERALPGLFGRLSPIVRDSVMIAFGMIISAVIGLVYLPSSSQAPDELRAMQEAWDQKQDSSTR